MVIGTSAARTPPPRHNVAARPKRQEEPSGRRGFDNSFSTPGRRGFDNSFSTPGRPNFTQQRRQGYGEAPSAKLPTPAADRSRPSPSARFESPTATAVQRVLSRVQRASTAGVASTAAVGTHGGTSASSSSVEAFELFSQLQSIVVQLSTRAVEDKKTIHSLRANLDAYAQVVAEQEALISQLRQSNEALTGELRSLRRSGYMDGSSNDFARALVEQLRTEQRERMRLEEQQTKLLEEQQRSIQNLEARLRCAAGATTAAADIVLVGRGSGGELSARRGSPLSSRRGGTPSRFAQHRAAAACGGASPLAPRSTASDAPGRPSSDSAAEMVDAHEEELDHHNSTTPPAPDVRLSPPDTHRASVGARQRDQATQDAFRRFAEALRSVQPPLTMLHPVSSDEAKPVQDRAAASPSKPSPTAAGRAGSSNTLNYPSPPFREPPRQQDSEAGLVAPQKSVADLISTWRTEHLSPRTAAH